MEDNDIFEKEPQWDQDRELRSIQKTIRKRNQKLISVSVILAAVLLLGSVYGIIPQVEKLYWNPEEAAYKYGTDLEVAMEAYTELFVPGYGAAWVTDHRTGFASYELQIRLYSHTQGDAITVRGSLERNVLRLDDSLSSPEGKSYPISRRTLPEVPQTPSAKEALRERLAELPDYVRLEATVSFVEDLSMEELLDFRKKHCLDITWVAVRSVESYVDPLEDTGKWIPQCGMAPFTGGRSFGGVDLDYRYFDYPDGVAEQLEQHFISLLQYSADQIEKGRGIAHYGEENLYDEMLEYVEENGVKTYGVVVTASPQELLELMEGDLIYSVYLVDGWLDLG